MNRSSRIVPKRDRIRLCLLILAICVVCNGARPHCAPPANIYCGEGIHVEVRLGYSVYIPNPCSEDGIWSPDYTFGMIDPYGEVDVSLEESDQGTRCELHVNEQLGLVTDMAFEFIYKCKDFGQDDQSWDWGTGFIYVTTLPVYYPLQAVATADPAMVRLGESTQLDVEATCGPGGWYEYRWWTEPGHEADIPEDQRTLRNPVATPSGPTTYFVEVDDDGVEVITTSVQVRIDNGLTVSASPSNISAGGTSQLAAVMDIGVAPYSYAWLPVGSLSDATIQNPVASPDVTTTYQVVVTDAESVVYPGTVVVRVRTELDVAADPSIIEPDESSQLSVVVTGGRPPYSYEWTPAISLDDADTATPAAWPNETTTYTVAVTDADNLTYTESVTVQVLIDLQACFTYSPQSPSVFDEIMFDAGCSTGYIDDYSWWFDYDFENPDLPPDTVNAGSLALTIYEEPGVYYARLLVTDSDGNESELFHYIEVAGR